MNKTIIFIFLILIIVNCSKSGRNPVSTVPDEEIASCDTVFVDVFTEVIAICDTFNLSVEFTLIKDQSAPNIYGVFKNNREVDRIIIADTSPTPVEVIFPFVFNVLTFNDKIFVRKIEGSRAEAIGSQITDIECL